MSWKITRKLKETHLSALGGQNKDHQISSDNHKDKRSGSNATLTQSTLSHFSEISLDDNSSLSSKQTRTTTLMPAPSTVPSKNTKNDFSNQSLNDSNSNNTNSNFNSTSNSDLNSKSRTRAKTNADTDIDKNSNVNSNTNTTTSSNSNSNSSGLSTNTKPGILSVSVQAAEGFTVPDPNLGVKPPPVIDPLNPESNSSNSSDNQNQKQQQPRRSSSSGPTGFLHSHHLHHHFLQDRHDSNSNSKSSLNSPKILPSSNSSSNNISNNTLSKSSSMSLSQQQSSLTKISSNSISSLPYIVLEYDKNQVIIEAHSGSFESPVWASSASFDVSREDEEVFVSAFVKTGNSKRKEEDIFLGSARIIPPRSRDTPLRYDTWVPISATAKIHFILELKPSRTQKPLSIEQFDLLKVIGKGSFGKVMQVRKKDTGRIYALKTIRKAHIVSRSEVSHTLAERTVSAQVHNPFIVPLKFSFQSPEKLYLVLAFVNGGELFHHLQREGRFDLNRSRFYTAELLCALECLHKMNVIYRDLKPENILLDYTGHIALCDFGLCKLNMQEKDKTNTFCGTPEYLAPELLQGNGYTKVVDWWTLGVLLYEMLTGLPPFYDENTNEMYRKILYETLTFPEDMDRSARSILKGLLTRDPTKRLGVNGSMEIKNHPFFRDIDWNKLLAKKYSAPFKPSVKSATDTSNFDKEFTSEVPTDSVSNDFLSESVQQQFGGWTYSDSSRLGASAGKDSIAPGSVVG